MPEEYSSIFEPERPPAPKNTGPKLTRQVPNANPEEYSAPPRQNPPPPAYHEPPPSYQESPQPVHQTPPPRPTYQPPPQPTYQQPPRPAYQQNPPAPVPTPIVADDIFSLLSEPQAKQPEDPLGGLQMNPIMPTIPQAAPPPPQDDAVSKLNNIMKEMERKQQEEPPSHSIVIPGSRPFSPPDAGVPVAD